MNCSFGAAQGAAGAPPSPGVLQDRQHENDGGHAKHGDRLFGDAVKEGTWNSDSGRLRISFNEAAFVRYSEQLHELPARGGHECL